MKDKRVINTLKDLIQIPSENPGSSEKKIATYISKCLKDSGFKADIIEYEKNRSNVVCIIKNKSAKKTILLSPHIDTVPAGDGWRHDPFKAEIVGSRIYGRGAADCKINIAVALEVLRELHEGKFSLKNFNIVFAATADEETGSHKGFVPLIKDLPFCDYSLILDGEDFKIGNAQKGLMHVKIDVFGKKAHGAYLELGDNAVLKAVEVYQKINAYVKAFNNKNKKSAVTINLGKMHGGDKVNMVPDTCALELDIRFLDPLDIKVLTRNIKSIVGLVDKKAKISILHQQEASYCEKKSLLVSALKGALKKNKKTVRYQLFKGATVLSFVQSGSEAIILGFGDENVFHITNEYVSVKNVLKGVDVLRDTLIELDKSLD